jgi:predicted dehydrogenase
MTRVGLAGFGSAGRGIHAPLMRQAGMTVAAVSSANPERVAQAEQELPGVTVVSDLEALLQVPGLDLIVLATPSGAHGPHAHRVIEAGLPLVVDKPLAVNAVDARAVVDAAAQAQVPLTVFQNRRFDAEHVAARDVVRSGELGEVFRGEMRWERWRPVPRDRWRENAAPEEGGGILLDLQTHLVDQAVDLFGPVETVYAEVAARTTRADDDAFLACRHASGVTTHLGTSSVAAAPGPRLRILGRSAAFVLNQFEADLDIYPDLRNADEGHVGWIYAGAERRPVSRGPASQVDFYRAVAAALQSDDPQRDMPVDPQDAVHTLAVIDAARASAASGVGARVVTPGAAVAPGRG